MSSFGSSWVIATTASISLVPDPRQVLITCPWSVQSLIFESGPVAEPAPKCSECPNERIEILLEEAVKEDVKELLATEI